MKIYTFSGCSASGKNYFIEKLAEALNQNKIDFDFIVSFTTREKRNGEENGKDYHFINRQQFEEKIKNNEFIEYIEVNGNYYGTPLLENENKIYLHIVEPNGVLALKKDGRVKLTSTFIKDFSENGQDLIERIEERVKNSKNEIELTQNEKRKAHLLEKELPEWNKKANYFIYDEILSVQKLKEENAFNNAIEYFVEKIKHSFRKKIEIDLKGKMEFKKFGKK